MENNLSTQHLTPPEVLQQQQQPQPQRAPNLNRPSRTAVFTALLRNLDVEKLNKLLAYKSDSESEHEQNSEPESESEDSDYVPQTTHADEDIPEHQLQLMDLGYNMQATVFKSIGKIHEIVSQYVAIQAFPGDQRLSLGEIVFLDNGRRPLGYIYNIWEEENTTFCVIEFSSRDEVESQEVRVGLEVFVAGFDNKTSDYKTQLAEKILGNDEDESWSTDDSEDDSQHFIVESQTDSIESYKKYEAEMNRKNTLKTELYKRISTPLITDYINQTPKLETVSLQTVPATSTTGTSETSDRNRHLNESEDKSNVVRQPLFNGPGCLGFIPTLGIVSNNSGSVSLNQSNDRPGPSGC